MLHHHPRRAQAVCARASGKSGPAMAGLFFLLSIVLSGVFTGLHAAKALAAAGQDDFDVLRVGGASIIGLATAVGPVSTQVAVLPGPLYEQAAGRSLYSGSLLVAAASAGTPALAVSAATQKNAIPLPPDLAKKDLPGSPETTLAVLLGMPYRDDGAIDETGSYTLFADPARRLDTPGLNCSGLVLEASRLLLGKNITLAQAKRDRLGDSGPNSPLGEDWDFGWDLILNISDGFARRFLLPGNRMLDPEQATGMEPRGHDIHSGATWRELPARLRPGHLYLFSLNVEGRRKGYGLIHYHVGLIHVAADGKAWLYQTTGKGETANRRDINSAKGRQSFQKAFANTGGKRRMMLLLEVELPKQ